MKSIVRLLATVIFLFNWLFSWSAFALPAKLDGRDLVADKTVSLEPLAKGTVLVFISARCPCSASHEALLQSLPAKYPEFRFVGIHSNVDEPAAEAAEHFKKSALGFPVLQDDQAKIANEFRALKTPHAFVVSPTGEVLYKGGVTDSHVASNSKKQYLSDALDDLKAGRAPRVSEGRALGCAISRSN